MVKHVESVGGKEVIDGTAMANVCTECGGYDLSTAQLAGYERRAAALVLRDGRFVNGSVVKYARKALGLRQVDLGRLLTKSGEQISRWENDDPKIPKAEQLAILYALEAVEAGESVQELLDPPRDSETLEVPPPRRVCG